MIDSLYELSETVTKVANRMLEIATENTSSGQYYVGHDDVADLISFEDYLQYHHFIEDELSRREEVLDLDLGDNDDFDIVCGLAWCKNYEGDDITSGYEELRPAPSMAHMADVGRSVLKHVMKHGFDNKTEPVLGFGITEDDLAFSRVTDNFPEELREMHERIKPLADHPPVPYEYEELLVHNVEARTTGSHKPIEWCYNTFGQYYGGTALSDKYPEELAVLGRVMQEKRISRLDRSGSIINGKPVVELAFQIGRFWQSGHACANAQTKMAAAQLERILYGYNASFQVYSPGYDEGNLLLAQIPATAPQTTREHFEADLEKLLDRGLPLTSNIARVEEQYNVALEAVRRGMPEICRLRPSLAGFEEEIAEEACAVLGSRIGDLYGDFIHAQKNRDAERYTHFSDFCDFRKNTELLGTAIDMAADRVGFRNHQWVRIATSEPGKGQETFILHRGELRTILNEMGYDKTLPISQFLSGCSYEAAKEIKEIYDARQKPSLDAQMGEAKNRSTQQGIEENKDRSAPERE